MNPVLFGYVLPLVHVLACLFLIVVVLLQTGKGADMGAVMGGGSQTLFGASGAGNLLTKLTTGMAITFMGTSLLIAVGQRQKPSSSLIDRLPDTPAVAPLDVPPPPAAPVATDAAAPATAADTAEQQADAKPADAPAEPSAPPAADALPADAPAVPAAVPPAPEAAPANAPPPAGP